MNPTPSLGKKKCFINYIDNCTRYCYLYLLNGKDETIETYGPYKTEVKSQLNIFMIRSVRCKNMNLFLQKYIWKWNHPSNYCIFSPQSNETANRKNRTLKKMLYVL